MRTQLLQTEARVEQGLLIDAEDSVHLDAGMRRLDFGKDSS
jgi:hypothetical protein